MGRIHIKKLSIKVIVFFLLPSILILSIVGVICVENVSTSSKRMMETTISAMNGTECEKLDTFFQKYKTILERASTDKELKYFFINLTQNVYERTKSKVYQDTLRKLPYYLESMGKDSEFVTMWIADVDAKYLMEDSHTGFCFNKNDGWDMTVRSWYPELQSQKKVVVTSPYQHFSTGKEIISIISPVYSDTNNTLLGVVAADIRLTRFRDLIERNNTTGEKTITLFDRNGKAFYSTDIETSLEDFEEIFDREDLSDKAEGKEQKSFIFQLNGKKMIGCISEMDSTGWTIFSSIPYSMVNKDVNAIVIRIVWIFLIGILILALFLYQMSTGIIHPIKRMNETVGKIADGNYEDRLEIDSYDEIGQLSESINLAIETLCYRSEYDSMTGLYNKETLFEKADAMLEKEFGKKFAAIIVDIRQFKIINDIYGRNVGDDLIYALGVLVNMTSQENCLCARAGGDIFYIFREYNEMGELMQMIQFLHEQSETNMINIPIHLRFGINSVVDSSEKTVTAFDCAQLALEKAKMMDGCSYAFYDTRMREQIIEETKLENMTEKALDEHQFIPYFQPKVSISTGKVVGAEALVRWKHPERGMIRPDLFIPMFERTGKIVLVDEYMWEETCKTIRSWIDQGKEVVPISVNVSRVHVYDETFVSKIKSLCEKYQIPPKYLILEVTESMYMDNLDMLDSRTKELSDAGFRISMDDFGAGYSSLNTLKDLALDEIKIDQGFLNETVTSDKGKIVISEVITMIKRLQMKIVAEGVETKEQAEYLKNVGCDIAQGFYYSRPIPREEFENMAYNGFEKI